MPRPMLIACLLIGAAGLSGCSKGNKQADALDKAAAQSDPAAAAELRNQADAIRDSDTNGAAGANLAAPGSPAQEALQAAGDAAANNHDPAARPANQSIDRQTGLTR